ncbi:hypothetical protein BLNAU_8083 [Blattamonas nauphoetae]|uniref:RRM domain-containing protein n=1 Tax=Blattamonas nauphoetae TaxID=2049346 RepID=A0ABQ9XZX3_9EUKA|nr:hypothetical protein BLNAU_8083 [Blattamonas nauphoetae]
MSSQNHEQPEDDVDATTVYDDHTALPDRFTASEDPNDGGSIPQLDPNAGLDNGRDVPGIYIENIRETGAAAAEDLKKLLTDRFGPPAFIDVKFHFAFVYYTKIADVDRVIAGLNGTVFQDRSLRVSPTKRTLRDRLEMDHRAVTTPSISLFVSGYDLNRTYESDLRKVFCKYGSITRISMMKAYSFVVFEHLDDAIKARRELDGTLLNERPLVVNYSEKVKPKPAYSSSRRPSTDRKWENDHFERYIDRRDELRRDHRDVREERRRESPRREERFRMEERRRDSPIRDFRREYDPRDDERRRPIDERAWREEPSRIRMNMGREWDEPPRRDIIRRDREIDRDPHPFFDERHVTRRDERLHDRREEMRDDRHDPRRDDRRIERREEFRHPSPDRRRFEPNPYASREDDRLQRIRREEVPFRGRESPIRISERDMAPRRREEWPEVRNPYRKMRMENRRMGEVRRREERSPPHSMVMGRREDDRWREPERRDDVRGREDLRRREERGRGRDDLRDELPYPHIRHRD